MVKLSFFHNMHSSIPLIIVVAALNNLNSNKERTRFLINISIYHGVFLDGMFKNTFVNNKRIKEHQV